MKGVNTDHILGMQKEEPSLAWNLPFTQQVTATENVGKRWCISWENEDNWAVEIHGASARKKPGNSSEDEIFKNQNNLG